MALAAGLGSLVCAVLHVTTDFGPIVFAGTIVLGALGVIFGGIALRKRQPRSLALTGMVAGIIGFLFGAGLFVFALVFIGAFTL